jgi:hypothetical protein
VVKYHRLLEVSRVEGADGRRMVEDQRTESVTTRGTGEREARK